MGGIRSRVGALKGVRALLLLPFDLPAEPWELASSFSSPMGLAGGLLQEFRQAQDPQAIAVEI